jgi:hypothetical protein
MGCPHNSRSPGALATLNVEVACRKQTTFGVESKDEASFNFGRLGDQETPQRKADAAKIRADIS